MSVLSRLDVDMVNLHAAGASEMMKAALEGLTRPDGTRPLLIAVTQLTSTDAAALKNELLIDTPMAETVLSYAKNAAASGLDGVVCSPLEAALVKERCGEGFLTVTPGIRFADSAVGDQKRIMTPEKAAGPAATTSWWAALSPRPGTRWPPTAERSRTFGAEARPPEWSLKSGDWSFGVRRGRTDQNHSPPANSISSLSTLNSSLLYRQAS